MLQDDSGRRGQQRGCQDWGGGVGTANTEATAQPLPLPPSSLPQLLPTQPRPSVPSPGPGYPEHLLRPALGLRAEPPWSPICGPAPLGNPQLTPSPQQGRPGPAAGGSPLGGGRWHVKDHNTGRCLAGGEGRPGPAATSSACQLLRGSGQGTATKMGAWALLLSLLVATARAQGTCGAGAGGWAVGRPQKGTDSSSPTFQSAL